MNRTLALGTPLVLLTLLVPSPAQDRKSAEAARAALKELNDFIGQWNGSGAPVKPKPASTELWSETIGWGWRFKGDDGWMEMTVTNGRHFKGGELRYLPGKKLYQLTATDSGGRQMVFEGEYQEGYLRLEGLDPEKKETQRITMNTAAEGIRFIFLFERRPQGRTLYVRDFQVACNREGESLATAKRKTECVVSGGLGTIAVSHQGETYYVCCSGCRDAFNENPPKYIAEFKARQSPK